MQQQQQQSGFNYATLFHLSNSRKKNKVECKTAKRRKLINYIDLMYGGKVPDKKA